MIGDSKYFLSELRQEKKKRYTTNHSKHSNTIYKEINRKQNEVKIRKNMLKTRRMILQKLQYKRNPHPHTPPHTPQATSEMHKIAHTMQNTGIYNIQDGTLQKNSFNNIQQLFQLQKRLPKWRNQVKSCNKHGRLNQS